MDFLKKNIIERECMYISVIQQHSCSMSWKIQIYHIFEICFSNKSEIRTAVGTYICISLFWMVKHKVIPSRHYFRAKRVVEASTLLGTHFGGCVANCTTSCTLGVSMMTSGICSIIMYVIIFLIINEPRCKNRRIFNLFCNVD